AQRSCSASCSLPHQRPARGRRRSRRGTRGRRRGWSRYSGPIAGAAPQEGQNVNIENGRFFPYDANHDRIIPNEHRERPMKKNVRVAFDVEPEARELVRRKEHLKLTTFAKREFERAYERLKASPATYRETPYADA